MRRAVIDRNTAETQIRLALNVDGTGPLRQPHRASASSITCWTWWRATVDSTWR